MSVPGFALRIARLPVRAVQAGISLAAKLLKLTVLVAAGTALVLVLDVLLFGRPEDREPS